MSGNQKLPMRRELHEPLELNVYRRSQTNIRMLQEKLPSDLVINLAREVILRVASKDNDLKHVKYAPSITVLENFCIALISDDDQAAAKMIAALRADGVRAEDIYLKHLATAARLLGDMWTADRVTFSQVTVGTGRMFGIMRSMRHLFDPVTAAQDKTAIFAAVPGEDHTLGVRMAADIFRKEGWEIALKVGLDHDQLVAEIAEAPSGIVGLSISGDHSIDALSRLVVALHIACPHVMLIVSGQDIEDVRPVLSLMGLDGIASTLDEARAQMATLWATNMAG